MTLILMRASEDYVTQAVDRLVTYQNGGEFDPRSNKAVVYACSDAIVSITYTGIAFLGNIPTDQWLVEQITQRQFDRTRKPAAIGLGQNWEPAEGLGQTLFRINSALARATKSIPLHWKTQWKREPFDLLVAGWHWNKRGRTRPILAAISKGANSEELRTEYHNRLWHHRRPQGKPFIIYGVPKASCSAAQMQGLKTEITNKTWQDAELIMVQEIRRSAEVHQHVGKHVLTVTLSPPDHARGIVTDHPLDPLFHTIRSSFVGDVQVEVHLTPWLVGPGLVQPPSLLSHTELVKLGPYNLCVSGPNKPGPSYFGSLQRPEV